MSERIHIAVIFPVFNRLEYTKRSLQWLSESIARANGPTTHIDVVVVDDRSTDGTAAWIQQNYRDVHVLEGNGNLWWSGGMNMAARHALESLACDYVVLWNNDIKCDTNYFLCLLKILRGADPEPLLGSKVYMMDPPHVIWAMGCYFNPRTGKHTLVGTGEEDCERYSHAIRTDYAGGMGTVVHREVIEKVGYWDAEAFPQYCGDCDFGLRAKRKGFRMLIHPDLKIWNDSSSSGLSHNGRFGAFLRSFFDRRSNFQLRTQLRFYRRHSESLLAYGTLLRMYAGYVLGFFKWRLMGFFGVTRRRSPNMQAEMDPDEN